MNSDRYDRPAENVLILRGPLVTLGTDDIEIVRRLACESPLRRARICAHPSTGDTLHQMLIALHASTYVPPHKHMGKSESFHVVDGQVLVAFFDDDGAPKEAVELAAPGKGLPFFHRISEPAFHTVIPTTELVVFHEITNGPFVREDMVFAPWGPAVDDTTAIEAFKAETRDWYCQTR